MFRALRLAFLEFRDPKFRAVIWKALVISFLCFVALWIAASFGVSALADWAGAAQTAEEGGLLGFAIKAITFFGGFAALVLVSFFLFPPFVTLVITFWADEICHRVEQKHYSELALENPNKLSWVEELGVGMRFLLITLVLNILLLPVYLALLFIPPLNLIFFYLVNGYLLGREYFEIVAHRHMPPAEARSLRKNKRVRFLLAGIVIAIMLSVPFFNIIAPMVAMAFMLHRFEKLRA